MGKHTPGPWKFDIKPRGKGWPGLFQVTTNILEYGLDGEEGIYIDNPADARLLSAAPEMLEILKQVVSVSQHDATLITRQVADRMRAIVAKTTQHHPPAEDPNPSASGIKKAPETEVPRA